MPLLAAAALALVPASGAGSEGPVPNDPQFPWQWALRNTGQTVDGFTGTPGSDINAVPAWGRTTGSRSIVIALVAEDGFDYTRADLAPNAWSNPGGVNGCPAGTHGYDLTNETCDPKNGYASHGNSMARIMGAAGNNGEGIAGVNWETSIMGVVTARNGTPSQAEANEGIDWAVRATKAEVNVRVLNASWGANLHYDQTMYDLIAEAGEHGILVVAGAGNNARDVENGAYGQPSFFPCGYDLENVICVAATDQNDKLWSGSNWGARSVDLAAPGVNICTGAHDPPSRPCTSMGTSDATALVTGAAALILADDPSLSVSELRARILDNVRPVAGLEGKTVTGGVLDVYCAMTNCRATAPTPPSGGTGNGGGGSGGASGTSGSGAGTASGNASGTGGTAAGASGPRANAGSAPSARAAGDMGARSASGGRGRSLGPGIPASGATGADGDPARSGVARRPGAPIDLEADTGGESRSWPWLKTVLSVLALVLLAVSARMVQLEWLGRRVGGVLRTG